jgi:parallel beta-helix repeat protein
MSKTKRSRIISILLIVVVFFNLGILVAKGFNEIDGNHPKLLTSGVSLGSKPITIMNDTDLDQFILDYSLNGTGTELDPYVLNYTNFEFSFNSSTTTAIHIENITQYLIIEDISVTNTNSTSRGTGIEIFTDNIHLDNVTIENTKIGMDLVGDNLTVDHSNIISREFGVKAMDCTSFKLLNTNITGADVGAYFESCYYPLISNNEIKNGQNGIQIFGSYNFRIEGNLIEGNSERGLLIVEYPTQSGMYNVITRNRFINNGVQAAIIENNGNTLFYDISTSEGNYWSDWRRWGDYKIQDDVFDPFPMRMINLEGDLEVAPRYPFKFWFWIFAPTLVVLGIIAYFFYWKLAVQPTKE